MLKRVNDFIILRDDPMGDGNVLIIIIFKLFKQKTLINADKNCVNSDDCKTKTFFVTILYWDKCLWEQSSAASL